MTISILIWSFLKISTDPEAIESIELSLQLRRIQIQLKRKFKLKIQYPVSVVPLAMFANWFEILTLGNITCIGSKVGHQIVSLAFPHCLVMPYWHYQLVLSLHQPESGQLSFNNVSQSRTPGISGSDKDIHNNTKHTDKILNGKIDTQSATSRHFCLFSAYVGVFSSDFLWNQVLCGPIGR